MTYLNQLREVFGRAFTVQSYDAASGLYTLHYHGFTIQANEKCVRQYNFLGMV